MGSIIVVLSQSLSKSLAFVSFSCLQPISTLSSYIFIKKFVMVSSILHSFMATQHRKLINSTTLKLCDLKKMKFDLKRYLQYIIYMGVLISNCYIFMFNIVQYWTSPGGNNPQSTNYTATYLPSQNLSKLDKPDTQDTAGEAGTSS